MAYLIAIAICAAFAALEGLLAGRGVQAKLATINQPRWAAPLPVWIALGLIYYALCFVTVVRLVDQENWASWPFLLLMKLMAANAVWNLIFFRARAFGGALAFNLLYLMLFLVFWWQVGHADRLLGWLWAVYAGYQAYALAWGWSVWRRNLPSRAAT